MKRVRRGCLPATPTPRFGNKNSQNVVFVSARTPFAAAITRVSKLLARGNSKVLVIGLGRTVHQALQVGAGLMDRKFKVSIKTTSAKAIDELIDSKNGKSTMVERSVPGVQLTVTA